jgi:hypothetical protein
VAWHGILSARVVKTFPGKRARIEESGGRERGQPATTMFGTRHFIGLKYLLLGS